MEAIPAMALRHGCGDAPSGLMTPRFRAVASAAPAVRSRGTWAGSAGASHASAISHDRVVTLRSSGRPAIGAQAACRPQFVRDGGTGARRVVLKGEIGAGIVRDQIAAC